MTDVTSLDLEAYLARIGYTGPRTPTVDVLRAIHRAHLETIPFENLDAISGTPVHIDLASVEAKLVHGRRGGLCFEQNNLLAAALQALGFTTTPLAGRVHLSDKVGARHHMLLEVTVDGEPWLADVGFGFNGFHEPLPRNGTVVEQGGWRFRARQEGMYTFVESDAEGDWAVLYDFTDERQYPIDHEVANYYITTHPNSPFARILVVSLVNGDERHGVFGRRYMYAHGRKREDRGVTRAELRQVLADVFHIEVGDDAPLRGAVKRIA
jgi:N-hydroxyarylamine O-acetyltransferase